MQFCRGYSDLSYAFILFLFHVVETCAGSLLDSGMFRHDKEFDDLLPKTVTQWSPADSEVQCGRLCQAEKWCNSFFYSHGKTSCALQRMVYRELWPNQTVTAPGWRYYCLTSAWCPATRDYIIDRLTATCYRLVTSPRLSWLAARAACNSSNERLVVLEPVEKARFLQDFLNTNIALHNFTKSIHTGASRPEAEWNQPVSPSVPSFVWVNGQPLNLNTTQTFWVKDPVWNVPTYNAVTLKRFHRYSWGTAKESNKRFYVCERKYS